MATVPVLVQRGSDGQRLRATGRRPPIVRTTQMEAAVTEDAVPIQNDFPTYEKEKRLWHSSAARPRRPREQRRAACPQSLAEHQRSLRRRLVPPFWREKESRGVRLADVSSLLFRERGSLDLRAGWYSQGRRQVRGRLPRRALLPRVFRMARLEKLTSRGLRRLLDGGVTSAVVPFGSVEAHGGHLPLGCDALLADIVGAEVALRINAIVAPTVRVGHAAEHIAETGTVTITHETLTQVAVQVGQSLFSHGFRRVILVPTHGGNQLALRDAVDRLDGSLDGGVACAPQGDVVPDPGKNSGSWLTSVMLAVAPDQVVSR